MNAESVKRKRLAGEYSDAAALPQGYSYTASPAQDGRSKCKGCRTQIQIGETRIGRLTKARQQGTAGDARQLAWYGTECGCIGHKDLKDMYSTRQVFGFSALPKDEQAELEACLAAAGVTRVKEKQMLSRLLYPNPVCMLSTPAHVNTGGPNVMTISWLTPLNNFALILLSVNAKRHTATKLQACPEFVLNIPAHGFEETVLAIGKNTGADGDKFEKLGIATCGPGWEPLTSDESGAPDSDEGSDDDDDGARAAATSAPPQNPFALLGGESSSEEEDSSDEKSARVQDRSQNGGGDSISDPAAAKSATKDPTRSGELIAIAGAMCHIVCKVRSMTEEEGHWLVQAEMTEAFVRRSYWNGKQLCARDPSVPPFLTFLGSQRFGYVVSEPTDDPATQSDDGAAADEDAVAGAEEGEGNNEQKHQRQEGCESEEKCSEV